MGLVTTLFYFPKLPSVWLALDIVFLLYYKLSHLLFCY